MRLAALCSLALALPLFFGNAACGAKSCQARCEEVATACGGDAAGCANVCATKLALDAAAGCTTQADALAACTDAKANKCEATGCATEQNAYTNCIAAYCTPSGGSVPDACLGG
jgi:hypothetical protein